VLFAESDALHARVRAFIEATRRGGPAPEPFDDLALAVARFQAAHVPPFARLLRARGVDLAAAREAAAIPAVPADVFRLARVAAHPPEADIVVFRTSGTTQIGGQVGAPRGEHALRTTETYELAALSWGQRFLWPDGAAVGALILAPPLAEQPDSSLGFMLDRFARALGGPASFHVHLSAAGDARLDLEGLAAAAAEARAAGRPTLVLATSFALVHLIEQGAGLDLRLPAGSRVMQTGGFKGRSREVAPDELRGLLAGVFGVPPAHVVGEYGMTELSSQLYEGTLAAALTPLAFAGAAPRHGVYFAPPWVRVEAVDPTSLDPVAPGEIGVARIVDLANVDSAVVVQTADRVQLVDGGVELLGRLPGAPPRGCSIAADEMLGHA
jgi:hypothetical protein